MANTTLYIWQDTLINVWKNSPDNLDWKDRDSGPVPEGIVSMFMSGLDPATVTFSNSNAGSMVFSEVPTVTITFRSIQ